MPALLQLVRSDATRPEAMSSSRISLNDCSLSLRFPILSHTSRKQTPDKIALQAAATPSLDHTDAYTGSTILILLTLTLPPVPTSSSSSSASAASASSNASHSFVQHASDPHVYLIPKRTPPSPVDQHHSSPSLSKKQSLLIHSPSSTTAHGDELSRQLRRSSSVKSNASQPAGTTPHGAGTGNQIAQSPSHRTTPSTPRNSFTNTAAATATATGTPTLGSSDKPGADSSANYDPIPTVTTTSGLTRLPLITESSWRVPSGQPNVLIKALWVLVRAPPETSSSSLPTVEAHNSKTGQKPSPSSSMTGKDIIGLNDVLVEIRERTPSTYHNSAVSATIYRASRLFGRASNLRAFKQLRILRPIDISAQALPQVGNGIAPYVRIVIENITDDAFVSVVKPYFHMATCRRLSHCNSVTFVEPPHPAIAQIHRLFRGVQIMAPVEQEPQSLYGNMNSDHDDPTGGQRRDDFATDGNSRFSSSAVANLMAKRKSHNHDNQHHKMAAEPSDFVSKFTSAVMSQNKSDKDHGIPLPEFNPSALPSAILQPRDVYVFLFRIDRFVSSEQQQQQTQQEDGEQQDNDRNSDGRKGGSGIGNQMQVVRKSSLKTLSSSASLVSSSTSVRSSHSSSTSAKTTNSSPSKPKSSLFGRKTKKSNNETESLIGMDTDSLVAAIRKVLSTTDLVQTDISVAWQSSRATDACVPDAPPLRRELSAGGVLATSGRRATVAVGKTSIEWSPVALLDGLVISICGPSIISLGNTFFVRVSITNYTRVPLLSVRVIVQDDHYHHYNDWQYDDDKAAAAADDSDDCSSVGGGGGLMALRTAVVVGRIEVGDETKVQIPCISLRTGLVRLGQVTVVCQGYNGGSAGGRNSDSGGGGVVTEAAGMDDGDEGRSMTKWIAENEFQTLAVNGHDQNSDAKDLATSESRRRGKTAPTGTATQEDGDDDVFSDAREETDCNHPSLQGLVAAR